MMDFKRISVLDLSERSALSEIKESADEIIDLRDRNQAFEMLRALEGRLRYLSPQQLGTLAPEYEAFIANLKFVAFADLAENDAIRLVQYNVVDVFSTTLNLSEQIRMRIIEIPYPQRDEFKKKIRDALLRNTQRLTSKTIALGADNRPESPTIENWIRDYTYNVGTEIANPLQQAQYFSRNPNIIALAQEERERVRTILALYERLKYPSTVLEGLDETIPFLYNNRYYLAIDGQLITIGEPRRVLEPRREIGRVLATQPQPRPAQQKTAEVSELLRALHQQYAAEDEARYQEQEKLLAHTGGNTDKIIEFLKEAMLVNDNEAIVVTLEVLSRSGSLATPLQSKTIRDAYANDFLRQLATASGVQFDVMNTALEKHRDDPHQVAAFLQWSLMNALHAREQASARIGNQIENILAALGDTRFLGMTYFDVAAGSFRWTPLRVKADGTLEWVE